MLLQVGMAMVRHRTERFSIKISGCWLLLLPGVGPLTTGILLRLYLDHLVLPPRTLSQYQQWILLGGYEKWKALMVVSVVGLVLFPSSRLGIVYNGMLLLRHHKQCVFCWLCCHLWKLESVGVNVSGRSRWFCGDVRLFQ